MGVFIYREKFPVKCRCKLVANGFEVTYCITVTRGHLMTQQLIGKYQFKYETTQELNGSHH